MSASQSYPSINALSGPLVERLVADAPTLRLSVSQAAGGARMVDAGAQARGSIEAGRRIAEICLGGLGTVTIAPSGPIASWPYSVTVHSADPVLACLGSQYAGWSLAASKEETGGKKFFALGSGPARALAGKEKLFGELAYRDQATQGVLVLEVDRAPPAVVIDKVLRDCGLAPEGLTLILTPTSSPAESGRVTNTLHEPRDSSSARRRFSSIIGPRMKPSSSGAGSARSLMKR